MLEQAVSEPAGAHTAWPPTRPLRLIMISWSG